MAMGKYNHQIIHFNNGLHGWHLNDKQYEEGLRKYVRFLMKKKANNCQLVFSLSTPYPSKKENIKLNEEMNPVVLERNRIAMKVMSDYDIPVIDLYVLVEPKLEKYSIRKGDLHYKKEGYELMAGKISSKILELMGIESKSLTEAEIDQGW
jgi:lysophospholipase L1-like esterase